MHKRTLKWIVLAAAIAAPLAAQAHKMWLLPSATNVAGADPWVTVDAAISNDLFHPDHHAASLEQLVITAPDGQTAKPANEAVGKYRAALAVRDQLDPDFIVMARTDARGAVGGGMDEVLKRGRAYLDAGVDVLYVEALQSREEIQTVRDAFPDALLRVTPFAIEPALSTKEIEDFRLCSLSLHVPIYGMIQMYDFLKECAVRGQDAWNEFSEQTKNHPYGGFRFFNLTGFPKVHQFEKEFLPKDNMDRYSNSIGVYDPRSSS